MNTKTFTIPQSPCFAARDAIRAIESKFGFSSKPSDVISQSELEAAGLYPIFAATVLALAIESDDESWDGLADFVFERLY